MRQAFYSRALSLALLLATAAPGLALQAERPDPGAPEKREEKKPENRDDKGPLAIVDRNHHLGPGDVVEILVENYPDLSRTVRLFTDGTFDYPSVGMVQSAGLTIKELRERMVEALKQELRRPVVYVNLKEIYVPPRPEVVIPKITALGAVSRKGELDMPEPRPLRVVLALLGPLENADLSKIRVRYPDGSARTANFSDFAIKGPDAVAQHDFDIKGGEEIILLEKPIIPKPDPIKVTVLGAVTKPGTFVSETPISILEILDKVGGPKLGADLEKVEVTGPAHKNTRLVDVEKYISGDTTANYTSQMDDVIVVKEKPNRVLLVGDVNKKGWVSINPGATLFTTFLAAGGASGDYTKAELIRRGPDGKATRKTINIRDIEKARKEDVPLAPDDVIFIPSKTQKRGIQYWLQNVLSPVWLLRSIAPLP